MSSEKVSSLFPLFSAPWMHSVGLWVCFLFIFFSLLFHFVDSLNSLNSSRPLLFFSIYLRDILSSPFVNLARVTIFLHPLLSSSSRKFTSPESRDENVQLNNSAQQVSGHVKIIDVQQQVKLPQTNKPTIPANILLEKVSYSMECGDGRGSQSIPNSLRFLNCSMANYLVGISVPKIFSLFLGNCKRVALQLHPIWIALANAVFGSTRNRNRGQWNRARKKQKQKKKYVRQCLVCM